MLLNVNNDYRFRRDRCAEIEMRQTIITPEYLETLFETNPDGTPGDILTHAATGRVLKHIGKIRLRE